jgi:hypothetical protein
VFVYVCVCAYGNTSHLPQCACYPAMIYCGNKYNCSIYADSCGLSCPLAQCVARGNNALSRSAITQALFVYVSVAPSSEASSKSLSLLLLLILPLLYYLN